MLSTCSPVHDTGAIIPVQSPSHPPHYDPHSAIREIRRSLSRSPSKGAELRQYGYRSSPSKGTVPFSPSPLSPSRRSASENLLHQNTFSSPHQGRFGQSARFQRPVLRRSVQGLSVSRTRTSPQSPSKRVLCEFGDRGNTAPMLRKRSSTDAEIEVELFSKSFEDKENRRRPSDEMVNWKSAHTKQEKRRSGSHLADVVPLSPMKRSGEPMNLDQPDYNSPSTKRRSLHAASGLDFSIFDSDSLHTTEKRAQDDNDWQRPSSPHATNRFSTIPKRSSSLRKSTLQQRQTERASPGKFSNIINLNWNGIECSPDCEGKKTSRLSLDNHLPAMQRGSPFPAEGNLLSASIHPVASSQESQIHQSRHPLSRTITQCSSTPSTQDDSPTHEPIRRNARPKSTDFSKSLPVGAMRPIEPESVDSQFSSQPSFTTPANYKSARPLPAAFMSTGLISKRNRNAEEPDGGLPKAHMPDTPCKRQSLLYKGDGKFNPAHAGISKRHNFGTPGTPAETPKGMPKVSTFPWGKSTSLFGPRNTRTSLVKKASFASIEGEDKISSQSPSSRGDSQSTDVDYPPTPTKHATLESCSDVDQCSPPIVSKHQQSRSIPGTAQSIRFASSKLSPIQASPNSTHEHGHSSTEHSPTTLKPESMLKILSKPPLSFTRSRALRNLNSPTPLSRKTIFSRSSPLSPAVRRAKMLCEPSVSPHLENIEHFSPHTPQEGIFPPDPSGLSISGRGERPVTRAGQVPYVPATPTGPREYFGNFSNRPSLNLHAPDVADVDRSLSSRFDKIDLVGTGEFSQVYRVSLPPDTSSFSQSLSISRSSSSSSLPNRVWAVKKSRYPYTGPKDRLHKVHEVDVLKTLGHSDHIVSFVDSWEDRGHLYIQTEFCEEGTLDVFLAQVGLKARLDDFRIWKVLLELSLGLNHIHSYGFIHLDLKPANVLVTFDGTLKIGDFGMAATWPAKAGIEGEGDREYIGPEILLGQYDKPADIFALGLIMLETAGNVELPDNGVSWQKLRQGDMSDVPSLTFSSTDSVVFRDAKGVPLEDDDTELIYDAQESIQCRTLRLARPGELIYAPNFMVDPDNEQSLDHIVRWMISPKPADRPLVEQVLQSQGVQFVESRRRAGATVFEGNWGPADEVIAEDAEMMDV